MTHHWRWLPGALVVLLAGACTTTPDAPGESALTLERMQQAAVDFTRARDAGDALAMARAAGVRRPFDHLTRAPGFLHSAVMFEEARRATAGNEELLAQIDELENRASGPSFRAFSGGGQLAEKLASRCRFEHDVASASPLPAQRLPVGDRQPPSCVLTVDAKTSVQLRVDVRARRTLFVYVESKAGADLALTIIDPAVTKPICSESQPHGYQACKWRPGRAATGIVEIRNDGNTSVSALLIARQS